MRGRQPSGNSSRMTRYLRRKRGGTGAVPPVATSLHLNILIPSPGRRPWQPGHRVNGKGLAGGRCAVPPPACPPPALGGDRDRAGDRLGAKPAILRPAPPSAAASVLPVISKGVESQLKAAQGRYARSEEPFAPRLVSKPLVFMATENAALNMKTP
jgi:hypothetical protein